MSSKVQISNMALSRLGASTITSLTDGTQEAKLCNTFFDTIAPRVMTQGSWTSVTRRASLARTTNTPAFEFTYEFQLPVDPKCLRVLRISEDIQGTTEYVIEGDKLLSDDSTMKIKYIANITDSEEWDVLLTEAVELALASYLAAPLTGSADTAETLRREYAQFLDNNLAVDGQQGTPDTYEPIDLTNVR